MPKGPQKLRVTFGAATLTHYGGVYLLHRFFTRVGFKRAIAQGLRLIQRNNRYSVGEMLLALLYPMLLGLDRIETTQLLRQNGVFQYLTGLPSYPNATTLRRFLIRVAPTALPKLRALHDSFLHRMTLLPEAPSRLIFDVDSTVLVVYGKQEQARIGYNPIKRGLAHLRYTSPSRGVEAAEFRYQPTRWRRSYRFVVIRRPQPEEPTEQLTLFKLGRYHYQVLVTNLPLQPLNLWRFYNDRAGIELVIRQLKGDYALGRIPSHHFLANETYFHLLLLAYNLINWFKRLCLPPQFQNATLQTLRQQILLMPAQLVRAENRPRLDLPASGPREAAWEHALRAVDRLRL